MWGDFSSAQAQLFAVLFGLPTHFITPQSVLGMFFVRRLNVSWYSCTFEIRQAALARVETVSRSPNVCELPPI